MRNGAPAYWVLDYSTLKPDPGGPSDPPSVSIRVRDPSGSQVETASWPGTIVRDSLGVFHWTSQPLVYAPGGEYTFVAKAPGFPELRMVTWVERSAWDS